MLIISATYDSPPHNDDLHLKSWLFVYHLVNKIGQSKAEKEKKWRLKSVESVAPHMYSTDTTFYYFENSSRLIYLFYFFFFFILFDFICVVSLLCI